MPILKQQYKIPSGAVIKRKGSKFLFLVPSLPAWIITNSNGANALKLCNGLRSVEEISRLISRFIGRDAKEEIHNFFQEIVSKTKFFSSPALESPIFQPYNLRVVHLNLTDNCNLKCIYCYADERNDDKCRLQFKDYLALIDSINNISKKAEIVLTGGEPLLTDYSLDVAEYAKKKGNKTHLLTNGVLINQENVKRITKIFDLIKVSLDGSMQEIHDFHRGKGSFEKTSKAIELLFQNKAPLQISMTVTRKNINDIKAMVDKFGSLVSFAPLFKAGRAKVNKKLAITGKEYYNALSSVKGVNPLSCLCDSLNRAKNQPIMKCAIGDAEISISDTGNVYPCHLLHLPQFLAGNIKEQSLEFIYQSSDKLKLCRKLTVLEVNRCKKCEIRFICGGACRARAFYEKDKIDVSDDFCGYEKLAFINGLFELHKF